LDEEFISARNWYFSVRVIQMKFAGIKTKITIPPGWDQVIVIFSFFAAACSLYLFVTGLSPEIFFDSDLLYLPSLYRDLFIDGYSLAGWSLTPAPYYFPDMVLYFLLRFITGDFLNATLVYAIIQPIILIYAFRFLLKQFLGGLSIIDEAIILLAFITLFSAIGTWDFLKYVLLPSMHTGSLIMSIVSLALFIRFIVKPSLPGIIVIFALCMATAVSDMIFLVYFVLPVVLTFIPIRYLSNHLPSLDNAAKALFASITGSVTGLAVYYATTPNRGIAHKYMITDTKSAFESLYIFLNDIISGLNPANFFYLILILLWISISLYLVYSIIKNKKSMEENQRLIFLFFTVFLLAQSLITLSAVLITGNYSSPVGFRYLLPLTVMPLLGMYAYLSYYLSKWNPQLYFKKVLLSIVLITSCIVFTINLAGHTKQKSFTDYYPELVEYLDNNSGKYGLSYGLSDYWHAKLITMFSRKNLRVNQVQYDLQEVYWINNREWYEYTDDGRYKFNFIITDRLPKDKLLEKFGSPGEVLITGRSEIWIYLK